MSTTTSMTLPQLGSGLFLTDGGIETSLIFIDGLDLPYFAAFHLLRDKTGRDALVRYYERYIAIAQADGVGFILESPTWRASSDWGNKLGYSRDAIGAVNRKSIELMHELKARHAHRTTPIVVAAALARAVTATIRDRSCPPPRLRPIMLIRLACLPRPRPI